MSVILDLHSTLDAVVLGIVEGVTEFLPVSSTGHLLLMDELLDFQGPAGKVFEIVIQFGAILAICWLYRAKFIGVAANLHRDVEARRFAVNILIAFLPAAVVGVLLHGFIKSVLFSPWVVAVALIVGGILILVIERHLPRPRVTEVESYSTGLAFKIGCCQIAAMIPGVSRSGATILGALLLGSGRAAATEFSFFLAVPTMLGATVYDLYKNWSSLHTDGALIIAVGFVVAFLSALPVVRSLVGFISRHGLIPFAWYRIALGLVALVFLSLRHWS